jgi:uncharacterized protein
MDNVAGTPVEGENFHARAEDVARLLSILENDDILLLGPRRIGKTSIARAVMAALRNTGWHTLEINVASCQDEREFLEKLESKLTPVMASMPDKARAVIKDGWTAMTQRIQKFKIMVSGAAGIDISLGTNAPEDWTKLGSDCLSLIAKVEGRWLIYVDELPIMLFNIMRSDKVNGVQRVRRFLDWFRNDVRALPDVRSIRWLVSGSVGLDTLVQQHGMADTINSFKHEGLAAFTEPVAMDMLAKLAVRYQLALEPNDAARLIAAVLWPQPYYLQLAFHHLRTLRASLPTAAMVDLIAPTIQAMVEPGADNDFHHWEKRLSIQLSVNDANHCLALLTMAAADPQGANPEALLAELQARMPSATAEDTKRSFVQLRDILLRDAYWWPSESTGHKRYRFRLEPLRLWWLRRSTL